MSINKDQILVTEDEFKQLNEELEYRKVTLRKEIAAKIKIALGFGDLSENAEYTEAKEEQNHNESKIIVLEDKLKRIKVVKHDTSVKGIVQMGSKVKIYDIEFDEELDYTIVGTIGADPFSGKISQESPLGKALLDKKANDTVEVTSPGGDIIKYKVLEIN
ncbi:transcription elongation factor GreA [Sedimentibacter sp. zth1]|uniref:transcription elongation factor GreA n=1 Tax=Sedimentibacter sp. zth1 TaxID=2816908 RepID=UPI001A92887A|nr:transcription elongation factor GreA [Sedimentibacter sp. zth1]QSX07084.1 transcription elongation factor GreA [Sedimentibacter sp. zth1]